MNKIIIFFFIILIFVTYISTPVYSQIEQEVPKKELNLPNVKLPQTIQEAEMIGVDFLNYLPGEIKRGWGGAINIWTNMYIYSVSFFNRHIKGLIQSTWNKIWFKSKYEVSEKKDILKQEIIEEKEEVQEIIKETSKKVSKSLWQIILEKIGIRKQD